ncbi:gliding motility-associated protein GldE [Parvicella tangerina]|nr:gliding motility-associated protein GldE [Parvicella tangerina]
MPFGALLNILEPFSFQVGIALGVMAFLLLLSGLMSGSEVAYFSLSASDKDKLKKSGSSSGERVLRLLETPKKLLATILIANNFVNVAIVAVSTFITNEWVSSSISPTTAFIIQAVLVTFIILLFGEVIPKVYATKYNVGLAKVMSSSLLVIKTITAPLTYLLVSSSNLIDGRIKKKTDSISVDHLEHALTITKDVGDSEDEKRILEGIVKFGNTDAKQIMTPRVDVVAFDVSISYDELRQGILDSKYSRLPIYEDTFDQIKGIIYVKDLLKHIGDNDLVWQKLLRPAKFIPENKKLDDLLSEFQESKNHMAVVVDEYGGASGVVTLEDVLEEVVGDITDEFDDEDMVYSKLDDHNYVFEGKTPLKDMYRIIGINGDNFEEEKGESDTIAGFCIEQAGKILLKNEKVVFEDIVFTVEAADKRRIKQIKVTLPELEVKD